MIEITLEAARAAINEQFPEFASETLTPIESGGTDNSIFRLGEKLCARFPKREDAVSQIEKDHAWLRHLSPLPLKIPSPVEMGTPSVHFPHAWAILEWIPGAPLSQTSIKDWGAAADALADFILSLQEKDTAGGPRSGAQNHYRGVDLIHRDALTRAAIDALADEYPAAALLEIWSEALAAPVGQGAHVWLHGDLQGGNIIVRNERISAVIDFGLSGIGDPACDLMVAWSVLPASVRSRFRARIGSDEAAWMRGMGWALSVSTIALEYYRTRNSALSKISRDTISAVLEDQ